MPRKHDQWVVIYRIRTVESVALPKVVGMGFGKGEAAFGAGLIGRLEQIEAVDGTPESIGSNL